MSRKEPVVQAAGTGVKIRFAILCVAGPIWLFKACGLMATGLYFLRESTKLLARPGYHYYASQETGAVWIGLLIFLAGLVLASIYVGAFCWVYREWQYSRRNPEDYARKVESDDRRNRSFLRAAGAIVRLGICVPLLLILVSFVISNPIGWMTGGALIYWGCSNKARLNEWREKLFSLK